MNKRAEERALEAYPVPTHPIPYETTSITDRRRIYLQGYEQAQKDIAKALLAEYKKQLDLCPDADEDDDYSISETQQLGRFMMMEDIYEKFCEPVGVTLDDLEKE